MTDPYLRAGLARNPFVLDPDPGVAPDLWISRGFDTPSPRPGRAVQFLGAEGAGKTSHLLRIRAAHPGPYRHIEPDRTRWLPPPVAPAAYWDEADRIPSPILWIALRRARRAGAGLVLGTHRDLSRPLAAAGWTVETIAFEPLTAAEVSVWAARRIHAAAEGAPRIALPPEAAAAVARDSGASLRTAGDLLHVWAAREVYRFDSTARRTSA